MLDQRIKLFKSHRRGYMSLKILLGLYFLSWLAPLLCNYRPLLIHYDDDFYFPALFTYSETTFGGDFETEADYHDATLLERLEGAGHLIVWAPVRFGPTDVDFNLEGTAPSSPEWAHPLGTDDRARDILARLIFGFRISLTFGIFLAFFGTLIGIVVGAIQGYCGGLVDLIGQRLVEIWSSLPELFLLIILTSLFEPSIYLIVVLMSFMGWMGLSAYVRAEFLRTREQDFVTSAISSGASRFRVMSMHVLPNTLTPVITFFPFRVSAAIAGLAALDFLGLGVPSPTPSLGELLAQGKANLTSWWIIMATFLTLAGMITMLNFIGEAVQRALDPKASD